VIVITDPGSDFQDDVVLDDGLSMGPQSGSSVTRENSLIAAVIIVVLVLILGQLCFVFRVRIMEFLAYGKVSGYEAVSTELKPIQPAGP
jgi:hypothetical protein